LLRWSPALPFRFFLTFLHFEICFGASLFAGHPTRPFFVVEVDHSFAIALAGASPFSRSIALFSSSAFRPYCARFTLVPFFSVSLLPTRGLLSSALPTQAAAGAAVVERVLRLEISHLGPALSLLGWPGFSLPPETLSLPFSVNARLRFEKCIC